MDPCVVDFLAHHHWVASTAQLREIGVSKAAIQHARRTGLLSTPMRGVVALAAADLTFEGLALAAQLAAGGEAFVSGPSAAVLYGLRAMPRSPVEISVNQWRRVELPPWCRVFRTSWIDEERDVILRADGLRVATPLKMLFRLAGLFNQHRFERAAEDAWHRNLVTPAAAEEYLAEVRRSGRGGVIRFEAWLEKTSLRRRPSQSGLELDFIELIERVGLPTPERQFPLLLATGESIHLDLAWPDARLAVEPGHTWWHGGDLGQRRDQARDRACDVVGWQVERYDEEARRDPLATARELLAIYRRRISDLGGSSESKDH
jgi:Transcriptional regulator, AbiEi antitoxin N-terminal domain